MLLNRRVMNCCAYLNISFQNADDITQEQLDSLKREIKITNGGYIALGTVNQYQLAILKAIKKYFTRKEGFSVKVLQKIRNPKSSGIVTLFCIIPSQFKKPIK